MLRRTLLTASRSPRMRTLVETAPITRGVVHRFVPGTGAADAVRAVADLAGAGLFASVDHLGEDVGEPAQAAATRDAYVLLLGRLADAGLAGTAEVSVKPSAIGRHLPGDGARAALDHARAICAAAERAGTTVTLDMEDHTRVDSTLELVRDLRADFPRVGAVLQAYLRRTEADCRDLSRAGSRVRLCKGAYSAPASVAFGDRHETDLSYVRCLRVLMAGDGFPMVATHDPRLIAIAGMLAGRARRAPGTYEYQMLYGVRPLEQRRLAGAGERVRVYVPYGDQWYGYLMRRLAERPANFGFFARSLLTRQ